MSFIENIKERARANKKTIVLPETNDARTLTAAQDALKEGIANIILVGDKEEILAQGSYDLDGAVFMNPANCDKIDTYAQVLAEARKNKGMTVEQAKEILLTNPLFFGATVVRSGDADGMVAGAVNSSANVLRAALQVVKTAKGVKLVSSFMLLETPNTKYGENGVFVCSDCGLNQTPNAQELACIAESSAKSFEMLVEKEPKVAMLSYSTKGSGKHPDVDKVAEATKIAQEMCPQYKIDGEIQADAAIVPEVGASKAPGSDVAGHANVLIFPNLEAGNIGYKLAQRLSDGVAYGPITQGIAKPVNDLSRGCNAEEILGAIAISAVQAQFVEA